MRALVAAAVISGGMTLNGCWQESPTYANLNPSGEFVLTNQDGGSFRLSEHRGQVVLLFFGYLSCPNVCPTTLSKLAGVYSRLGPEHRSQLLTVFVTVDVERDTPAKLKEYLSYFSVNSVGLTGSRADVDKVVAAYSASYKKVETHSALGYLYDHSDLVYLIDGEGRVRRLFHPEDKAEDIAAAVREVLPWSAR